MSNRAHQTFDAWWMYRDETSFNNPVKRSEDCMLQAAKLYSLRFQFNTTVFLSAALYPWCFLGYNHLFGFKHVRSYFNLDHALAGLIREIICIFLALNVLSWNRLCTLPVPSSFHIKSIVLVLCLFFGMKMLIGASVSEPLSSQFYCDFSYMCIYMYIYMYLSVVRIP